MCNCKMCNWLKGLFGKKCNCEEKGCCEEKKAEEAVQVTSVEEKPEEVIAPVVEEKTEEKVL